MMDGNVLAGPLRELFAVDMTSANGTCAGCGTSGPVAALHVYGSENAPGYVARCPGCDAVMMTLVRGPEAAWLDMRGVVGLRIPLSTPVA